VHTERKKLVIRMRRLPPTAHIARIQTCRSAHFRPLTYGIFLQPLLTSHAHLVARHQHRIPMRSPATSSNATGTSTMRMSPTAAREPHQAGNEYRAGNDHQRTDAYSSCS